MFFFFLLLVVLCSSLLVLLLYLLNFLLSNKALHFGKSSAFESGFLSVGKIQNSFSLHFFVLIMMFVIFDVEVVMLLGLVVSDLGSLPLFYFVFSFVFFGLYLEWFLGKLLWVY